jgi:protein tyrosine phosphatase (PTP) superfamily phosphohydrolase (DUF442 family)
VLAVAAGAMFVLHAAYALALGDNFHAVVPGALYRSAQPSPGELRRWTSRYGIKTVINLRGRSSRGFYGAERTVADELGLTMVDVRLSAVHQPPVPQLRRLIHALETVPRPILLHCRRGADRTGVAGVLAAMAVGGQDYATARRQLSWRFGHLDGGAETIAGLLTRYERWCEQNGRDTAGWQQFRQWALSEYHPYYYRVHIDVPERLTCLSGDKLDVPVLLSNRSQQTIPAADPDHEFAVVAFLGSTIDDRADRVLGPRAAMPRRDIAPGESAELRVRLRAPRQPGRYLVRFDAVEEHRTWFARQGSPMAECDLTVRRPPRTKR